MQKPSELFQKGMNGRGWKSYKRRREADWHAVCPVSLFVDWPAGQRLQTDIPAVEAKVLTAQGVQPFWPVADEYCPTGHFLAAASAGVSQKEPLGQMVQAAEPLLEEKLPMGQAVHRLEPAAA